MIHIACFRRASRTAILLGVVVAALSQFAPRATASMDHNAGAWFMSLSQGKLGQDDSQFLWWLDLHARFSGDADGFEQSIVRPGIGYQVDDCNSIWAGYGWIATSLPAGDYSHEHRIWQQHIWSHKFGNFGFMARSRLEQRFFESEADVGFRFREFLKVSHPLTDDGRLYASVWNEIFIHLNDTDWGAEAGIDRNRTFVGLGYKTNGPANLTVEAGYLNQFINRQNRNDRMVHLFSFNLFSRF